MPLGALVAIMPFTTVFPAPITGMGLTVPLTAAMRLTTAFTTPMRLTTPLAAAM
jgi:hypothetical protein